VTGVQTCALPILAGKLNGFQLCKQLKNDPLYDKIKIILLTAKGLLMDVQEGISAKSDAYMIKPFSPTVLQKKVDELLHVDHLNMHSEEYRNAALSNAKSDATMDMCLRGSDQKKSNGFIS
jgi:DNA-binding response OmpR family regulator